MLWHAIHDTTRHEQADQEIWPGEGVFFGLSTVIKFPGNYSESPFSVIGSGVTCLPQRVKEPVHSIEAVGAKFIRFSFSRVPFLCACVKA